MVCVPENGVLYNQEETGIRGGEGVCPKLLLLNACTGITFLSLLFSDTDSTNVQDDS
jgi:hypothetical protein